MLVTWLPFRIKHGQLSLASDAWQLIDIARGQRNGRLQPPGATLGTVTAVGELLRRVGSDSAADYYQLLASLPRCELSDFSTLDEARQLCQRLPAEKFPEARQVLQFIEAAALVDSDDPSAEAFLAGARADAAQTPDYEILLFVQSCNLKLQRGETVGEELQVRLEAARRENRPGRVAMLEILAFEANPPQQAAAACQALITRHRRDLTETQRAQLLSFVTELLVERQEYSSARECFHAALASITTVSQSVQVPEVRRRFILATSRPLQRAMLISNDDMPLFINEGAGSPQVVPKFSKLALNLGWACIGFVISAYMAKATEGGQLPGGLFFIFTLITLACLLGATVSLVFSLVRRESRQVQGLFGLILGIVAMMLLVGLIPDPDHPRRRLPPELFKELEEVVPDKGEAGLNPASV